MREICDANHILIAEDNPYGLLGFEGQVGRAMRAPTTATWFTWDPSPRCLPPVARGLDAGASSLSKILGLQAEAAVLNPSVFGQELVAEYLEDRLAGCAEPVPRAVR